MRSTPRVVYVANMDNEIFKRIRNNDFVFFETALSDSVRKSELRTLKYERSGDGILHVAARHGKLKLLKLFTRKDIGLDIEQSNLDGKQPLHEAAQSSQLECVQFLLQKGAVVDCLKRADWTPLMLACTKSNVEVIKLLIQYGANTNLKNKDGWNAFHIACREGYLPVVEYLHDVNQSCWNTLSKNGRSPLHTAALHGQESVVDFLLCNCQYEVDGKDSCGSTPLMDALRANYINIAKLLITKHKANISTEDKLGRQPIHLAAQAGHCEAVKFLIDQFHVSVGSQASVGLFTPLHIAAKEGHSDVLEQLLSLGADVNACDEKSRRALHIATGGQYDKCVRLLLEHGAVDDVDNNGMTARKLAKRDSVIAVFDEHLQKT